MTAPKQSATVLPFKLPPDAERFGTRTFLIGNLFLRFGWDVAEGKIYLDGDDPADVADKIALYTRSVQAICEMPNEDIDELRKLIDTLEDWDDQITGILQYAKDYILDEWPS